MSLLAWHFLPADGCLANGDGRRVVVGETLRVDGPLVLCTRGLHASRRLTDALKYAPGPILCRVRLSGDVAEGDDKLCATERTVEWMLDATPVLRDFARAAALDAVHLWDAPEVVVRYLRTGDEEIRAAALDAARAAARAAALDAAWAAALDAAWAKQEPRLEAMVHAERRRVSP